MKQIWQEFVQTDSEKYNVSRYSLTIYLALSTKSTKSFLSIYLFDHGIWLSLDTVVQLKKEFNHDRLPPHFPPSKKGE